MIHGLGAAIGWGLADLFAAVSGRRIGSWATVVLAQVIGAALISVVFVVVRPSLDSLGDVAPWLLFTTVTAVFGYLTVYRALELGPIAVVSPVLASYAVIPVVLAVAILGEALSGAQVAGITVTIVGAILTSTDLRALRAGTHRMPQGLPWAAVAVVLFGVSTFVLGWASQEAGALPVLWSTRTGAAVLFALGAVALRVRRGRAFQHPIDGSAVGLAAAVGAADVLGTLSYGVGSEVALVSVVTAVSAIYPVIPVFGGVRLFGERPSPGQYAGVAMVIAGLTLLGLA